jgi:hypothetical protein
MRAVLLFALLSSAAWADACGASDLSGAYGFRHAGMSSISGAPKPFATVGRLVFGEDRHIQGTSSVNFGGIFLGNPVTGNYDSRTDCTFTFELQDDSGAWQHFSGHLRSGGAAGTYTQTDPGVQGGGLLERTPETCGNKALQGHFAVTIGAENTETDADGDGHFRSASGAAKNSGTYTVDSDCLVEIDFGNHMRGVVVAGGKTVLAVQTEPGKFGSATFTAR